MTHDPNDKFEQVRRPADHLGNVDDHRKNVDGFPAPNSLNPKAPSLLDAVTHTANISADFNRNYIVKDWLERTALWMGFGPSNGGKSFLGLDLADHVAKGEEWGGRRGKKDRVLYVATESGTMFNNRILALDSPEFWVLTVPMTFTGPNSQAGPLSDVVQHLAKTGGDPIDHIILDIMSRVMGALDEKNAPDIANLMRNLIQIRDATGAHIMLIHHSGKDVVRGARGHSSLRAAVDTEIELSRDDLGQIAAEVTKQRDGPTGAKFVYTLRR